MKVLGLSLDCRRQTLWTVVGVVGLALAAAHWGLLGQWDRLQAQRRILAQQALDYQRLSENVAVKDVVAEALQRWDPAVYQRDSDAVTLAGILRTWEQKARLPGLTLVGVKPLPVTDRGAAKFYRARVSLSGRLDEIVRYVGDITAPGALTAVESYRLSGARDGERVECTLALVVVRLVGAGSTPPTSKPTTASAGGTS